GRCRRELACYFLGTLQKTLVRLERDQTIHGAMLDSASKFEFEQFLLRVLWVESEARRLLKVYKSWDVYCREFFLRNIEEGSFAVARHYQREVANTKDKADSTSYQTPIARRTRLALDVSLAKVYLETPSKSTGAAKVPSTPRHESPSPYRKETPGPKELENVRYPPTLDEQIVNTALVIFLNALTIHFQLTSNCTLHRKAFQGEVRRRGFRSHGYLSHGSNPKSSKESLIQMQQSAQMVAWIKGDSETAALANTSRIHVSQDRHEIFITVAVYDGDYPSFMKMHYIRSLNTLNANHMQALDAE
ncbi:hypothetical protein BDW69DRAFT_204182, partial [Aspergillus filifer]